MNDPIYYNCVSTASGTPCIIQIVDNPVADLFDGFILFFAVFAGVIWFFRK